MQNTNQARFFVTGATGMLGRVVIEELAERVPAGNIVAGVRQPDHEVARQFATKGIEIRVADYSQPDTLKTAFAGIDRVLMISSTAGGDRVTQHQNVIDAARAAGIRLLAYTSMLHADTATSGLATDHQATESALARSGLPFVLLRHGWYTENHIPSVQSALRYGSVIGSADRGRFSSATRADYAAAAAVVLTTDDQAGQIHELAGDESYALSEFAGLIAGLAQKEVTFRNMPKDAFKQTLMGMGLPDFLAEFVAEADMAASRGEFEDDARQLSKLIGRPTTSLRDLVTTVAHGFQN